MPWLSLRFVHLFLLANDAYVYPVTCGVLLLLPRLLQPTNKVPYLWGQLAQFYVKYVKAPSLIRRVNLHVGAGEGWPAAQLRS
jgi:hypothetical protein